MTAPRIISLFRAFIAVLGVLLIGACERHTLAQTAYFSKPHGKASHDDSHATEPADAHSDKAHGETHASDEKTPAAPARKFFN